MTTRAAQIELLTGPLTDPTTGSICSGYSVEFYAAGTSTAKNVWTEKEKTNPFTTYALDSGGKTLLYGDGVYKVVIKNTDGTAVLTLDNQKVQSTTFSIVNKTGIYTATPDDDVVLCDGTFTVTLQAVADFEHPLTLKNIGSGTITVAPDGDETIDGEDTVVITEANFVLSLFPDADAGTWRSAYQYDSPTASQAEMEAGSESGIRRMSPENIKQAVDYNTGTAASQAEMEAGTESANRKMSPLRVHQAIDYRILDLKYFGATADGTTDDAGAINDALDFIRDENAKGIAYQRTHVLNFDPGRWYSIDSSINMTGIRSEGLIVNGNKAIVVGRCAGYPIIDMLDSQRVRIKSLYLRGDGTDRPSDGIRYGRGISGQDAPYNYFDDLFIFGEFGTSCMYNVGSEICLHTKCHFQNERVGGMCYYADARNQRHITSQFFSATIEQDTLASLNDNKFLNCAFEQIATAGGIAIKLSGTTNRFHFDTCYAQHQDNSNALCGALLLEHDHNSLHFDCHCEPPDISVRNVVLQTSTAEMTLRDFFLREYYAFGTGQVINNNHANAANFISSKIIVMNADDSIPVFGDTGVINFHGEICIGDSASLADFSNLNSLRGIVHSGIATASHTWPATKSLILNSSVNGVSTI